MKQFPHHRMLKLNADQLYFSVSNPTSFVITCNKEGITVLSDPAYVRVLRPAVAPEIAHQMLQEIEARNSLKGT